MIIEKAHWNDLTNYEKLVTTAAIFKNSQGFYSRLYSNLIEMDSDTIEEINQDETLKNCKDTLDVVLYLEQ
jgi:hypothetical protein